jgi:hypothetical protein
MLPRAGQEPATILPQPHVAADHPIPPTVALVVDNDPRAPRIAVERLQDLGRQVTEAPDGMEALALPDTTAAPGLHGPRLHNARHERFAACARIHELNTRVPIVLRTGYVEMIGPSGGGTDPLDGLPCRPFTSGDRQAWLAHLRLQPGRAPSVVPPRIPKTRLIQIKA